MTCGIYWIRNTVNDKKYIGLAVNIEKRWCIHKATLRGEYHDNDYLQKAWNKYGEESFEFKIIKQCERDEKELKSKEIYYIKKHKTFRGDGGGYNLNRGGDGNLGWIANEEQRRANSESKKGIPCSEEQKRKISLKLNGTPKPEGYGQRKQGVKKNYKNKTSSKHVGVYLDKSRKNWSFGLTYQVNGETKRIRGRRNTENEAASAYNDAAIKIYGNIAKINIIKEDI